MIDVGGRPVLGGGEGDQLVVSGERDLPIGRPAEFPGRAEDLQPGVLGQVVQPEAQLIGSDERLARPVHGQLPGDVEIAGDTVEVPRDADLIVQVEVGAVAAAGEGEGAADAGDTLQQSWHSRRPTTVTEVTSPPIWTLSARSSRSVSKP